jgi:hypothetical protein
MLLSPDGAARFDKKVRVLLSWMLDLFFSKNVAQHLTLREIGRIQRRVEVEKMPALSFD